MCIEIRIFKRKETITREDNIKNGFREIEGNIVISRDHGRLIEIPTVFMWSNFTHRTF